ncbi:hypothetical protein HDE_09662 [Halotydeus destructor]|nr:hypothetical protein HDE_09662 [Halotydeus destructor]
MCYQPRNTALGRFNVDSSSFNQLKSTVVNADRGSDKHRQRDIYEMASLIMETDAIQHDMATNNCSNIVDQSNKKPSRRSSPTASGSAMDTQKLDMAQAKWPDANVDSKDKWWASGNGLQKWTCLVCTYHNYPKSKKCVICYTVRGRRSPPHSPTPLPELETIPCVPDTAQCSHNSVPVDTNSVLRSTSRSQSEPSDTGPHAEQPDTTNVAANRRQSL